jgi:hypothetical protein
VCVCVCVCVCLCACVNFTTVKIMAREVIPSVWNHRYWRFCLESLFFKELEIVEVSLTESGVNLQTTAAVAAINEQKDSWLLQCKERPWKSVYSNCSFLFSKACRPAVLLTLPSPNVLGTLSWGVERPEREADYSPQSTVEVGLSGATRVYSCVICLCVAFTGILTRLKF